jgi:hypothetical protein
MRHLLISIVSIYTLAAALTGPPSVAQPAAQSPGPCEQITATCKSAGFVQGDYKEGYGLHVDCIDPIMRGTKQPAKAIKPLPSVAPELVAACKQVHPDFGEGKKAQAK